ncbi:hypothetical protein G2W53_007965 [Senna tora]|uniref:Uncharacterized protein n=1 Tax=Senna tora TaxID=362788 RepID=A0A834X695_9FABA|nr:hypothetical protein G2W53_007965 [Senna tora]
MNSTTLTDEFDNLFDLSGLFAEEGPSLINMVEEKTLKELDGPPIQQAPLCITDATLQAPLELKSGLIHLLPKFRGLANEDPYNHLKEFHVERFKELCASCSQHGIPEKALINFFYEEECSRISVTDTLSSSEFVNHSLNPLETALVLNSSDLDAKALEQIR